MKQSDSHVAEEKRHWVRITRRCNNNCLFCLDRESLDGSIIPREAVIEDLAAGRSEGAVRAIISGGEPTIHPDYISIVSLAKAAGYSWVQTITNGRMFGYADFLKRSVDAGLNEITFSLHGHTPELFEALTQVPGSCNQAFAGLLNAMKTPGLVVSVDIVVNAMNIRFLKKIIANLMSIGIREFDLLHVVPFGSAWKHRDSLFMNQEESIPYLHDALALGARPVSHIWTNRFPVFMLEGYESMMQSPAKIYDEIYGRHDMFEDFISRGIAPVCHGEQCSFCFMRGFCKFLFSLRDLIAGHSEQSWLVTAENIDLLSTMPPGKCGRIYLDPPELVQSDALIPFIKAGTPVTLVYHRFPDQSELETHKDFNIEIEINHSTAPAIAGCDPAILKNPSISFACHNYHEVESVLKTTPPLRAFFDSCGKKHSFPLNVVNVPPCISETPEFKSPDRLPLQLFTPAFDWNINSLAEMFIINKYYSQSLRCRPCRFSSKCDGLHINYIRAYGFKEIPGPVL